MRPTKSFSRWAACSLAVSMLRSIASVRSCKSTCFLAGLILLAAGSPNTRAQAGEATNLTERLLQTWIFEPLGWVGATPPPENETLLLLESAHAISQKAVAASKVFVTTTNGDTITKMHPLVELDLASLEGFVGSHPASPWTPALESQMGKYYREHGYYTLALKHWESAWAATKALDGTGKEIADITFAHWTSLLASLGRLEQLKMLFAETESRVFDGGVLQQLINSTREGAMSMQISPATSYQCGTFALQQLSQMLNATNPIAREFLYVPSPESGFSMDRLAGLAQQAGLDLVAVRRHDEQVVVPSIVHWRQNHYAAIVAQRGEFYRVLDPTFGGPNWLSKAAINAESSGSFLVPRRQVPKGWTSLAATELSLIYGKGAPNLISDTNDQHSCNLPGYNGQECTANCQHTARWWVSEPYTTLWFEDEPLGYQPSRGARMAFHVSFKQRNSRPDFDSATTFFNAGKLWEASWMSRISIANFSSGITQPGNLHFVNYDPATVYLAGGGASFFSNTNGGYWDPNSQEANKINQTKLIPLMDANGNLTGFNLLYADGSHDLYQYVITDHNTGFPIDVLLTTSADSVGNTTTFTYAVTNISGTNYTRLVQVLDVDGHTNTLRYQNTGFPAVITEVDDPYGRTNTLQYNSTGQLTNIVDPILLYSGFNYDSQGNVTKLNTKYGTTTFTATGGTTNYFGTNSNIINRSLQILDPNGGTQLYLYRDSSNFLPPNFNGLVPTNTPLGTLENTFLQYRDSFYWNTKQHAALSTTNPASFTSTDYSKGRMRHWLHVANSATNRVSGTLSLELAPSPDGSTPGQITWYDYAGKTSSNAEGTNSLPSVIARVLPEGPTQYVWYRRNELGAPTNIVDTYSATNGVQTRTNVYVYSTNAIDLLQHFGPSGELLESYGYNTTHQITQFTNALGEVTAFSYNGLKQLYEIDYPTALQTVNTFFSSGTYQNWLQRTIDNPINRSRSFTYTNGLVWTLTDERVLTTTNTWDALQRLTSISYPDGTYVSNLYYRLDLTGVRDRLLGKWTGFNYNPVRQLTDITNALAARTHFNWCNCGSLDSIVDATTTNTTRFLYDLNGRRISTIYPDGTFTTNVYDRLGRLFSAQDPAGNVTTYGYNNQSLLTNAANAFGPIFAAAYDKRDRATQFTDANGITLTNSFDNLDRLLTRFWPNASSESFVYSTNGLAGYTNRLGQGTRYGRDQAGRLLNTTNANLEVTRFTYNAASDLLTLSDGNQHLTYFYYDAYGRLTAKTNALNNRVFNYAYDADNRLTNRLDGIGQQTAYLYDAVGNLTNVAYPTATNVFTYDVLNQLTKMADATGTNQFGYNTVGQLLSETGPWVSNTVTYGYSGQLRTNVSLQMPTGTAWTNRISYDAERRWKTLTSPAGTFIYNYSQAGQPLPPTSPLVTLLMLGNSGALQTNIYDTLGQPLRTSLNPPYDYKTPTLGHDYTYNAAGQRTTSKRFDDGPANVTRTNSYDATGQLTNVVTTSDDGLQRPLEQFSYVYDAAGNLSKRTRNTLVQTFLPDALNQLSSATYTGTLTVGGYVTAPICAVAVNGQAAVLYFGGAYAVTNLALVNGTNTFTAIAQDSYWRRATNTVTAYLPTTATFQYDLNGNLKYDGQRAFDYDAENQLIRVTITNAFKSEWVYDGRFRRRIQREYQWQVNQWVKTNETRFVCDGNLVIQERDSNNVARVSYTRGADMSGSREGAGGIGGLLAFTQNGPTNTHYYYHSDGFGNVTGLVDTNAYVVARYQYDPFGRPIVAYGPVANAQPYGFSSKYNHNQSGVLFYERRPYLPDVPRFATPDPIAERGGLNLYRFVGNSPNNAVDPYGLAVGDWFDPRTWFFTRLSEQYRLDQYAKSHGYRDYNDALDQLNARLPNYDPNETDSIARELGESVQLAAEGLGDAATLYIAAATAVTPSASGVKCLTAAEQSAANKLNNILTKNFKRGPKGDISGAIHDMVGNPIPKPSGGTYDHVQDLGNLLRGLRNNADALKDATDAAAVAARQQALEAIQEIEEAIRGVGL